MQRFFICSVFEKETHCSNEVSLGWVWRIVVHVRYLAKQNNCGRYQTLYVCVSVSSVFVSVSVYVRAFVCACVRVRVCLFFYEKERQEWSVQYRVGL